MSEYSTESILSALEPVLDSIKTKIANHPVEYRRPTFVRALSEWSDKVLDHDNYQAV